MTDTGSPRVSPISEREGLPEDQRDAYDRIAESRGSVRGPFTVLLHSPEVAGRVGRLGAYLRYESGLSGTEREIAILTTAREFDCAYEWVAHERIARQEGVPERTIEVVADRNPVDGLSETEAKVVQYGRELLRERAVSEQTFRAAKDHFGVEGIVELTATIGYYSMIACVLNALRLEPEDGDPFS